MAETRMRPVCCTARPAMLHRVVVDVVHMTPIVRLIADAMFPVPTLPDRALTAMHSRGRSHLDTGMSERERRLDPAPACGEIGVTVGQGPDPVHVFRQHDPGIDDERTPHPLLLDARSQRVD